MANFSQVSRELAAVQAQYDKLAASMDRASTQTFTRGGQTNAAIYRRLAQEASAMSTEMRNAALSTGMFEVSQHKMSSATENFTKLITKQKLGVFDAIKNMKVLNATYQEQIRLQQMMIGQTYTDKSGRVMADAFVPKTAAKELDTIGRKIGFISEVTKSASTQMINWGKNTQWAGRQLMVGFTMPLAAFAATTGVMAYKVDQQLTRVAKVYDTTSNAMLSANDNMMYSEAQLAQVRQQSMMLATDAARKYGAAVTDTLDAEAQFAATGQTGATLLKNTDEAMRIATLGEMDYNKAVNATIALQSTMGLNVKQTTDAFNYMNAVENATSLSLQDFADAIPIAAAPVKQLGGDIHTLGELLVSMRERGINAVQGANAIKAAMTRLIRPSEQVQKEFQALTGADILTIRDTHGGDLIGMLTEIYDVTKKLNNEQRAQVFSGLFGTFQSTRMTAMIEGMGDLAKNVGQVSVAAKLAKANTDELARLAAQELGREATSASGKFRRAIEELKAEFASMGEVFLKYSTYVLDGIMKIVGWLDKIPTPLKHMAAIATIATALAGPFIMLTGLFANLVGQGVRLTSTMLGWLGTMKILDKETVLQNKLSEAATNSLSEQDRATVLLAEHTKALAVAMEQVNKAHADNIRVAELTGIAAAGPTNRLPNLGGMPLVAGPNQGKTMNEMYAMTRKEAVETEKVRSHMGEAAAFGGLFAASMAASYFSSNKTVDTISEMVMMFSLLTPTLVGLKGLITRLPELLGGASGANIFSRIGTSIGTWGTGIRTAAAEAQGFRATTGAILTSALGISGTMLAVGAAVAGIYVGFKKLQEAADNAGESINHMYSDTSALSKIIGYTPSEVATYVNKAGETVESQTDKVTKFAENYGEVVKKIQQAKTDQGKLNEAMSQGLKVISSGGTAEQAREAVDIALKAAGVEAQNLDLKIPLETQLKFDDPTNVVKAYARQVQQIFADEMKNSQILDYTMAENANNYLAGFSGLARGDLMGVLSGVFGAGREMPSQVQEAIKASGTSLAQTYITAVENGMSGDQAYRALNQIFKQIDIQRKIALNQGDKETAAALLNIRGKIISDFLEKIGKSGYADTLYKAAKAEDVFLDAGLPISPMIDGQRMGTQATAKEIKILQNTYNGAADDSGFFTSSLYKQIVALENAKNKVRDMDKYLKQMDWKQWSQDVWTNIQGDTADVISSQFQTQMDQAMQAVQDAQQRRLDQFDAMRDKKLAQYDREEKQLQAQHDREQQHFDDMWQRRTDMVSKSYDDRINRINATIEAEQKADEIRQRIFDAEMERIQRLSEMQNKNIDFNMALNQGQMDEAAKIRNDMAAQVATWQDQDAAGAGGRASQRRQDRLQDTVKRIENARDARLEALKKIEEAERRAMERRQQREDRELQRQRDHYDKMSEIQRKALEKQTEAAVNAAQAEWDARKNNLDKALAYFNSYIPKNEAQLNRLIADTSKRYDTFDDARRAAGDKVATAIRNSMVQRTQEAKQKLQSDINWQHAGRKIAEGLISGGLGMSWNEFRRWLATGTTKLPRVNQREDPRFARDPGQHNVPVAHHGGGWIGKGGTGRGGYSGANSAMPSETHVLAQNGEFMVNARSARKYPDVLEAINSGKADTGRRNTGGMGSGPGIAGMFVAALVKAMAMRMAQGAESHFNAAGYAAAKAGIYGTSGAAFDAEQLRNAAIIANVGQSMNMSRRDIIIGLMTALQESTLHNYPGGDRDSIGLFQQRPSMGWGTAAQVHDPYYAARKFFSALRGVEGRDSMPMTLAAQAVQRSAYPYAYAKWQDEATAILNAMGVRSGGTPGFVQGSGGRHRPVRGGHITQGIHDQSTGYPAIDIGVPVGTPVYAVGDGRITTSRDLIGNDGRVSNGGYYSYGRYVTMSLNGGGSVLYAHLNRRDVREGQMVRGGAVLGRSGNTGHSYGPHLHFGATPMSPWNFVSLRKGAQDIKFDNTVANLHRGEAVLTKDINDDFKRGVKNFADGGETEYNVHVHAAPGMNIDELVSKTMAAIRKEEGRKAHSRRVGVR